MRKIKRLPKVSENLRNRAKELRINQTDAERKIWRHLKNKQQNAFFHRQRVIGRYIVDFAAIDIGLIIEVDGSQHYTDVENEKDLKREEYLKSLGFKVIRFSNRDVLKNIEGVMEFVQSKIKGLTQLPPSTEGGIKGGCVRDKM